jgi:protein ImuA
MQRAEAIANLLRTTPDVWSGHEVAAASSRDTGFSALNALLPGYGWPVSSLIELIPLMEGIGELQLLLPVLRTLCREGRDVVFICPPHIPYPPALANAGLPLNRIIWIDAKNDDEARWSAEQILREGIAGAILLWSNATKDLSLRRLQVAAREGDSLLFLYRPYALLHSASPATVRIALRPHAGLLHAEVIKSRGGKAASTQLQLYDVA